ncbi:OmpA family protein [Novosphingobium aerophilum]|uniref:OmpA family protein n=1 Tax=Novosphingobium TaxID=165696 RepID=UPI002D77B2A6|nr:OmpA family protein [Novosphingobium sp. RL4]WRT95054.1 OmpA family protein [Novosphingobium sp. RL4]
MNIAPKYPVLPSLLPALLLTSLSACGQGEGTPGASGTDEAGPALISESTASEAVVQAADEAKKSIIRDDVAVGPTEAPPLEAVHLVVPFPAKGAKPDDAGRALIDGLLATPTFQAGGPVTLWGHSDSRGSDAENLAASRRRAEAVRDYLAGKGVDRKRIMVIAMGEARPIAPNRKLDGSDDPEGRNRNRRVEIEVRPPEPPKEQGADGPQPEAGSAQPF